MAGILERYNLFDVEFPYVDDICSHLTKATIVGYYPGLQFVSDKDCIIGDVDSSCVSGYGRELSSVCNCSLKENVLSNLIQSVCIKGVNVVLDPIYRIDLGDNYRKSLALYSVIDTIMRMSFSGCANNIVCNWIDSIDSMFGFCNRYLFYCLFIHKLLYLTHYMSSIYGNSYISNSARYELSLYEIVNNKPFKHRSDISKENISYANQFFQDYESYLEGALLCMDRHKLYPIMKDLIRYFNATCYSVEMIILNQIYGIDLYKMIEPNKDTASSVVMDNGIYSLLRYYFTYDILDIDDLRKLLRSIGDRGRDETVKFINCVADDINLSFSQSINYPPYDGSVNSKDGDGRSMVDNIAYHYSKIVRFDYEICRFLREYCYKYSFIDFDRYGSTLERISRFVNSSKGTIDDGIIVCGMKYLDNLRDSNLVSMHDILAYYMMGSFMYLHPDLGSEVLRKCISSIESFGEDFATCSFSCFYGFFRSLNFLSTLSRSR